MNINRSKKISVNEKKSGCGKILLIVVLIAMATSVVTVFLAMKYLFPGEFRPVSLSNREEQVLEVKLSQLDPTGKSSSSGSNISRDDSKKKFLTPEPYNEEGVGREIRFTEREINGLLAKNTDLASRLAIDLSDNLASAKLLIPLDPDFPFLGGKTLKVAAGLELRYESGNPVVALKGVSIWGVPIPDAWLGGIKNVDLVKEFGAEEGFWRTFSAGIENISVKEGNISIKLKK